VITSGHERPGDAPDRRHRRGLVVVGVDDSPQARAALAWAVGYAQRSGAQVLAVTAWSAPAQIPPGPDLGAASVITSPLSHEQLEADTSRWLGSVISELPADAADIVECSVVLGDPVTALLHAAHGADLLVLGNPCRGPLASAVVGSVAARCAHHAECPIVLVPDPARSHRAP
jgi:nucleotide-binding universal stress UspA family protein